MVNLQETDYYLVNFRKWVRNNQLNRRWESVFNGVMCPTAIAPYLAKAELEKNEQEAAGENDN